MISTLKQPLTTLRISSKPNKRKRSVAVSAKLRDYPKFAEAVNGRAAMYGMVFGSTNWGLFNMNILDQLYSPPTAAMTIMTSAIVIYTMYDMRTKTSDEVFERYAARDYGRIAMTVMSLMILISTT